MNVTCPLDLRKRSPRLSPLASYGGLFLYGSILSIPVDIGNVHDKSINKTDILK